MGFTFFLLHRFLNRKTAVLLAGYRQRSSQTVRFWRFAGVVTPAFKAACETACSEVRLPYCCSGKSSVNAL